MPSVFCPYCAEKIRATVDQIGSNHPCPNCGRLITLKVLSGESDPRLFANRPRADEIGDTSSPPMASKYKTCRKCARNDVDRSATKCPYCGTSPVSQSEWNSAAVVALLALLGLWLWLCGGFGSESASPPSRDWTADRSRQIERRSVIDGLIEEGVFRRVEFRTNGGTIIVGPRFYGLTFTEKQTSTNVVWSYLATEAESEYVTVRLQDHLTNRRIGKHDSSGLSLD